MPAVAVVGHVPEMVSAMSRTCPDMPGYVWDIIVAGKYPDGHNVK